MADTDDVDDIDERKHRSPNYPSIGFGEALQYARKVFEKGRRSPMSLDTATKYLGYGGINGTSKVVLSALRKYGLLEPTEGGLRISDDGAAVILLPKDDPARREKLQRLALRPPLFKELIEQYGSDVPADEALSAALQYRYRFTAQAAHRVIQSFRESLAEAGAVIEPAPPSAPMITAPGITPAQPNAESAARGSVSAVSPLPLSSPITSAPIHELWDLGDGARAELRISGSFGPDQLAVLQQYVNVLAFKVSKAVKRDANP